MIRIVPVVVCALLFSNFLYAQDDVSKERAIMERLESSIQVILNYDPVETTARLELVGEQNKKLAKLNEEYQKMIEEIVALQARGDSQSIKASKLRFLSRMTAFEQTLHSEILLPHQSDVLHSVVFANFVKNRGGSFLRTIEKYYADEFGLSSEQKKEMADIEKQATDKVAAAKQSSKKNSNEYQTKKRKMFGRSFRLNRKRSSTNSKTVVDFSNICFLQIVTIQWSPTHRKQNTLK